jgi:branched-chain amino acid transport system substrate-binding protein
MEQRKITQTGATRRNVIRALGAGAGAAALAGCLGGDGGEDLGDTLSVGVVASEPESDPITASIVGGAEIAAQELSADGGVLDAEEVEVTVAGAGSAGADAASAYEELVLEENVDITLGNFFSEGLINILDSVADEQKLHLVTGASTIEMSKNLREDYDRYKYFFRVGPFNNVYLGQTLVDFAAEYYEDVLEWNTTAVLYEDAAWTPPVVDVLDNQLNEQGFDVVDTVSYSPDTESFTPIFQDLQSQGVDGVTTLMASTGAAAAGQWAAGQFDFGLGGIHVPAQLPAIANENQLGSAINNVWTVNTASPGAAITDQTEPFTQSFMDAQGQAPVYTGYLSYDALHIYAKYAEEVGSANDDDIVDAMASNELTPTVSTNQNFRFWEPEEETRNGETYPHDAAYDRAAWLDDGQASPIINQWQNNELEVVAPDAQQTATYAQIDR